MIVGSPIYEEGRDSGYLARHENGHPYVYSGFQEDAGLIDYANPAAVAWVRDKFRALFAQGVAAIKADIGEGALPDAVYEGIPSASMHNLYPWSTTRPSSRPPRVSTGPDRSVFVAPQRALEPRNDRCLVWPLKKSSGI